METVLKNISFSVNDGDRVGVIGVNGAGKTSLFRIITGDYTADTGAVYLQKGYTVGCLEQNPDLTALPGDLTSTEYMYSAFINPAKNVACLILRVDSNDSAVEALTEAGFGILSEKEMLEF